MSASRIKNFQKGTGPVVTEGYSRGDSWNPTVGDHAAHSETVVVIGPGIGVNDEGAVVDGVLVRCGGCLMSWVLT